MLHFVGCGHLWTSVRDSDHHAWESPRLGDLSLVADRALREMKCGAEVQADHAGRVADWGIV